MMLYGNGVSRKLQMTLFDHISNHNTHSRCVMVTGQHYIIVHPLHFLIGFLWQSQNLFLKCQKLQASTTFATILTSKVKPYHGKLSAFCVCSINIIHNSHTDKPYAFMTINLLHWITNHEYTYKTQKWSKALTVATTLGPQHLDHIVQTAHHQTHNDFIIHSQPD